MKKRELEGYVVRIRQARRVNDASGMPDGGATDGGGDADLNRIGALERRVAHLERLLEGFQDSVYRETERHARMITELQLQVEPGAMRNSIAEDARNRGL
jgi:uncharacterized coiled-coil protein SlyX